MLQASEKRDLIEIISADYAEKQFNTVGALSYTGWGRFSKKFLEEITVPDPETGEVWNIITALWESNNNFSCNC